ncbi:MAG: hypothetical protein ACOYMF_16000 [Bacteroidales bacterium]
MNTIATSVIIAAISIIGASVLDNFKPDWKKLFTKSFPNKKRQRMIAIMAFKYIFLALAILSVYLFVPEGKWFVVFMCFMFLVVCYFMVRDHLLFTFKSIVLDLDKEKLLNDKQLWLNQLADCERNDKDRRLMILDKVALIDKSLSEI